MRSSTTTWNTGLAASLTTSVILAATSATHGCSGPQGDGPREIVTSSYNLSPPQLLRWIDWPFGDNNVPGHDIKIIQTFGNTQRCDNSSGSFHTGIDLTLSDESALGHDVLAAADGDIVCSENINFPGAVVVIRHAGADGQPIYTMYGHLEPSSAAPVGPVTRRAKIGKVGANHPGVPPHLHFEVRDWERDATGHCGGPGYSAVDPESVRPRAWRDPVKVYYGGREPVLSAITVDFGANVHAGPFPATRLITKLEPGTGTTSYGSYHYVGSPTPPDPIPLSLWYVANPPLDQYIIAYQEAPNTCKSGAKQHYATIYEYEPQGTRHDAAIELTSGLPPSIAANATVPVTIRVWNMGDATWPANGLIRLGITGRNPSDTYIALNMARWVGSPQPCGGQFNSASDGRLNLCTEVPPGGHYDFELSITPAYNQLSGMAFGVRMVYDGAGWFGDVGSWSSAVKPALSGMTRDRDNVLTAAYVPGTAGTPGSARAARPAAAAPGPDQLVLMRSTAGGPWNQIAAAPPRSDGTFSYIDHDVSPGVTYTYRAQQQGSGHSSPFSDELVLTAGSAPDSFVCPELFWSNACGEPQSGAPQQLACNPYDDTYQCVHGDEDAAGSGHWELRSIGGCLQSLGQTCAAAPTSFYACDAGADYCAAPVTGVPNQIGCGLDGARYQCTPDGWRRRADLGPCTQDCATDSASFTCPDLAWSNACGEPQSGTSQQLACNPYDDVYQCVHGVDEPADTGHWELRWIGDCLQALGITCTAPPASFYSCPGGTDFCGAPVTGVPGQIGCGRDGARYQCTPDWWHRRDDLGPCTQTCTGDGLFTCPESPGLCWEPQTGVQQELNCTPYNDVMQCVQGPDDPVGQGHWEVQWLGGCDAITGRHCTGS